MRGRYGQYILPRLRGQHDRVRGQGGKPEVPTEPTEPAAEEPEKKSGVGGILVVLLIVSLGGGAAFYIFKQKKAKPQTKGSADLDDYDYGEDEYEFEPYEANRNRILRRIRTHEILHQ